MAPAIDSDGAPRITGMISIPNRSRWKLRQCPLWTLNSSYLMGCRMPRSDMFSKEPITRPQQSSGVTAVIGPNGVKRASYDFGAGKSNVSSALNEICKGVNDASITPALHPHTGTCIDTRERVFLIAPPHDAAA